jgi:hypothetical protein
LTHHAKSAKISFSNSAEVKHFIYEFSIDIPLGAPCHRKYFFEIQLYKSYGASDHYIYKGKAIEQEFNIQFSWIDLSVDLEESLDLMKLIIRREFGFYKDTEEQQTILKEKEKVLKVVTDYQNKEETYGESIPFSLEKDEVIDKTEIIPNENFVHGLTCGKEVFFYDVVNNTVKNPISVDEGRHSNYDKKQQIGLGSYYEENMKLNKEYWQEYLANNSGEW